MKNGWQEKSVGDILQLEYGKPLDESDRKPNGLFPVYGANGEKDRTDKFYYDKPSIIVGRKGSAGEINLTEKKFWPLDVTYFATFDESQHDLRFLYYLLTTLELTKLAKGVKPGINRNEVYSQITRVPRSQNSSGSSAFSTKRLRASPPPKPTQKRTSTTPMLFSKVVLTRPSLANSRRIGVVSTRTRKVQLHTLEGSLPIRLLPTPTTCRVLPRDRPSCRRSCTADMPGVWLDTR